MKIRVVDLETTGRPEDAVKGIVEIGWTDVVVPVGYDLIGGIVYSPHDALVDPGHPIPPETRAVHHISDADVAGAMDPGRACATLMDGMSEDDVFAAHNAEFEKAFFGGGGRRWICTMQCAKHIFPEAPGFSNQVLRYWLDVDRHIKSPELAMPPHRAGPDTYVTAFILHEMLQRVPPEELIRLTAAPVLLTKVSFGKHKGRQWSELPWDYLEWVAFKSDMGRDEKHTAKHYLGR